MSHFDHFAKLDTLAGNTTPGQVAAAARVVAERATGPDDAALLLQAIGILDSPPPRRVVRRHRGVL